MPVVATNVIRAKIGVNASHLRRGLLTETCEKVGNVHYVGRIPNSVVIHRVLFSGLVLDDIQENVDRRFAILGCRTIPMEDERRARWYIWKTMG